MVIGTSVGRGVLKAIGPKALGWGRGFKPKNLCGGLWIFSGTTEFSSVIDLYHDPVVSFDCV